MLTCIPIYVSKEKATNVLGFTHRTSFQSWRSFARVQRGAECKMGGEVELPESYAHLTGKMGPSGNNAMI